MAMESFSTANSLFVDECFEDALSHYSKAIELAGEDCPPDYFTKRSFTHFKLKNFTGFFSFLNISNLPPPQPRQPVTTSFR
mmetsp:Transcript_17522/g.24374  ORF Transcript_17522/g.24374 Transcript_17522/m.24374 type:complete len:81 (+) Transcript_17522:34-276(+)